MRTPPTIHPFPARMAPEIARDALKALPPSGRVLDPMCGSGTVVRAAVELGASCVGIDIDPLAVLMARAWTTPVDPEAVRRDADELVREAKALPAEAVRKPPDAETRKFVRYWFAPEQRRALARLSSALANREAATDGALAVALSRIIVSKEMMASLARDTSHSRPHRVADTNDFDVYGGFARSASVVAKRLRPELIRGRADTILGDARGLAGIADDQFDLVITSPPYLNAIDYLRGHRLALVWMGHAVASLRAVRGASVGAERIRRKWDGATTDIEAFVTKDKGATIGPRHYGWIRRYAADMDAVMREIRRAVKATGRVVLVLGNSFIRGARVDNAGLVEAIAVAAGFSVAERRQREIPARRRYLPPPGPGNGKLDSRLRVETVLTLRP